MVVCELRLVSNCEFKREKKMYKLIILVLKNKQKATNRKNLILVTLFTAADTHEIGLYTKFCLLKS